MNAQNQAQQGNQAPQNNNQGGPLTNANAVYQQDQRNDIGQNTISTPGTVASYETVARDAGIANPSGEY
jgi:hypothetical protein